MQMFLYLCTVKIVKFSCIWQRAWYCYILLEGMSRALMSIYNQLPRFFLFRETSTPIAESNQYLSEFVGVFFVQRYYLFSDLCYVIEYHDNLDTLSQNVNTRFNKTIWELYLSASL